MTKKNLILLYGVLFSMVLSLFSCSSDDSSSSEDIPLSADIFQSTVGKKVAFQGLTNSATSWAWDFGDGTTSSEKNPVHVYSDGGYYTAKLTATSADGGSITKEVNLALDITPYVLLTGGATAESGKTWRISSGSSANDYFAYANAELTPFPGAPYPLPAGIFGSGLGMGEIYEDEFTFYFDGNYSHDVKADGAAFSGYLYQYVTTGGAGIVNGGGVDFGLCTGVFTPESGATFTYVESDNFETSSAIESSGTVSFNGVSTLSFSGTEFIGLLDFERRVIIQNITDKSMRLVMFLAASQDAIGVNTNAVILTFEAVE
ncbi:PKD domain-containing protein [Arenibacter echinorum]|uniref:PKD domain-containing protein n=1 Tax=Arenibacter echinorum TaxID=440515 RepID=A0A327R2B4_9FLAO|nr:PKD domain-containing protein [Arenibacter echinorum]RAJ09964.1 PKD domain-containing protein [Arenibacter echinorum]